MIWALPFETRQAKTAQGGRRSEDTYAYLEILTFMESFLRFPEVHRSAMWMRMRMWMYVIYIHIHSYIPWGKPRRPQAKKSFISSSRMLALRKKVVLLTSSSSFTTAIGLRSWERARGEGIVAWLQRQKSEGDSSEIAREDCNVLFGRQWRRLPRWVRHWRAAAAAVIFFNCSFIHWHSFTAISLSI